MGGMKVDKFYDYVVKYTIESDFINTKVLSADTIQSKVGPDEISFSYIESILESILNLKEGTYIVVQKVFLVEE